MAWQQELQRFPSSADPAGSRITIATPPADAPSPPGGRGWSAVLMWVPARQPWPLTRLLAGCCFLPDQQENLGYNYPKGSFAFKHYAFFL